MRGGHVGHPIAQGLIGGVLEGTGTRAHRNDRRAQHLHAVDVETLSRHVLFAHIHDALKTESSARRCGRHPVLSCACLGNDPRFLHASGEQHLTKRVVDLVGARVGQVFSLEQDGAADDLRKTRRVGDRSGAASVGAQEMIQLAAERRIARRGVVYAGEFVQRRNQRLRNVPPTIAAKTGRRGATGNRSHGSPSLCHRLPAPPAP